MLLVSIAPVKALQPDTLVGKPVIGINANGRLEVFSVNAAGELRHRWQKASNGDWSSWSRLGDGCLPGIAIGTNRAGEMFVFAVARDTKALRYVRQKGTNSFEWSNWNTLGGSFRPPVSVGQSLDGRIEVFAVDARSNSVWQRWQTNALTGSWAPRWANLGGNVEPGLALAQNKDGRLELFGVEAESKSLVHCFQKVPNGTNGWSEWSSLGGTIQTGFAARPNVRGRMEVFAVNYTNKHAQRICQTAPSASQQWAEWEDFGGQFEPGLAIGKSADGRLEIIGVDAHDSTLLHRWEILSTGADEWSEWASLGATAAPFPAVIANEDGDLEVFAQDLANRQTINHRRQISRASDWLDWASLDHATFQYSSRRWQVDEGLPHNTVQTIAQTTDGYLWVGTRGGLARFDGVTFTTFDKGMGSVSITTLCADRTGALWIGTDGAGVFRLLNGAFSHYTRTNGLAGEAINAIYERKDGSLWIGTATGMSKYKDGRFFTYTKKEGLSSDVVRSVYEDRDGNLWIATGEGLNRLRAGSMDSFRVPKGLPNDSVRCISQDRGGRIWIGSNNGMLWYSSYWGNFFAYNTRFGLSDTFVSAIREDREGNLWVGTYSGLNRFREGRFFPELDNEGVPFDRVKALFEDREGNLWVGSEEGLVRLTPERFFPYTKLQGLAHNNVVSVLEDRSGSFWVGTWGGGVNRIRDERVTAYTPTNDLSQTLILSLCEARDGSLWAGADFDGGLSHFKDGRVVRYTQGLPKAPIRVIHEDNGGSLWLGTARGLSRFDGTKFTNFTSKDGLPGNAIRDLCEDAASNLWIGTETGLSCLRAGKFKNYSTRDGLSDNAIMALFEDDDQNLWIGTTKGGLNRYRDGKFRVYTTHQGLFSDEIYEIIQDDLGWLWMTCSKGVFRVHKRDLDEVDTGKRSAVVSVAFGKNDGLESTQCSSGGKPAVWKSRDGHLSFATSKGFATVNPASVTVNLSPPPVFIEEVVADRKPVLNSESEVQTPESTGELKTQNSEPKTRDSRIKTQDSKLSIPPGRGDVEFRYTALNFQAPGNTRFKHKLEPTDSEWVDDGTRRTAHYYNVAPGDYQFRVIACNKDGVWNDEGASLAFVLRPHYWQTWWAQGAAGLLILGGVSGIARYMTRRRMSRQLELLEQRHAIEKERGRIAKDIHDDLGSSLTRIMMLGERAEEGLGKRDGVEVQLGKIVTTARHTVQALDEIVWAVNPENDSLEGLVQYIGHYADELFEESPIRCRLELPTELPARNLSAEVRHDLFLVIKEAFHNILKHSKASQVYVKVTAQPKTLQILIEDDGCGFDLAAASSNGKGNGLRNMRRRVDAIHGELDLTSTASKGTRIKVTAAL
jgi:ligand-binding sensor domain-containing protein/signal transduction histidine kinase